MEVLVAFIVEADMAVPETSLPQPPAVTTTRATRVLAKEE
jgi:hypothetical protein